MHITTPAQGFWNWAHFQGHNIWGNSHNAPFDHSVCTLIYKYRLSFSKSYHFPIALQYYDKFYLTWLHNVTFCGDTNQANILKFTYITIFIKKLWVFLDKTETSTYYFLCLCIIVPSDSECCCGRRLFQWQRPIQYR